MVSRLEFEIKLTSFADDITFLVKDTQSLRKILKLIKRYGIFSFLKMNVEKCEACWIDLKVILINQLSVSRSLSRSIQSKFYEHILVITNCWKRKRISIFWLQIVGPY